MIDAAELRRLVEAWEKHAATLKSAEEAGAELNMDYIEEEEARVLLASFLFSHTSELLALVEADGWRPIESAPRDGTRILVWSVPVANYYNADEPPHVAIAYWLERRPNEIRMGFHSGWVWHGMAGCTFTHWRPLPKEPAQ